MSVVGINIAFPPKRTSPVEYYRQLLKHASQQGITVCRIVLSEFSFNYHIVHGRVYKYRMGELLEIMAYGSELGVQFVVCLHDFNEFSTSSIHWDKGEHSFESSALARACRRPIDYFAPEYLSLAVSKFQFLRDALPPTAVFAWEMFNEIDLVEGFSNERIDPWVDALAAEMHSRTDRPVYLSYANPQFGIDAADRLSGVQIGLHTYSWPYGSFYKNVIYWQMRAPSLWIMECGSDRPARTDAIIALVASYLLNTNRQVAMPWYWDSWLACGAYPAFIAARRFIDDQISTRARVTFSGSLGRMSNFPAPSQIMRALTLGGFRSAMSKAKAMLTTALGGNSRTAIEFYCESDRRVIRVHSGCASQCTQRVAATLALGALHIDIVEGSEHDACKRYQ